MTDKEKARAYDKFLGEAIEGRIVDDGGEIHLAVPELPAITRNMDDGDRVKIVFIKED